MRSALARGWRWLRAPAGRGPRLALVAACALIVGLYATNRDMGGQPDAPRGDGVYRPVLARGDGHMMYLMARSTALDLDWVFDNDLARFGDPWRQRVTRTGRKAIAHPIGPALVWTPLIWLAQLGAWLANALGARVELHGYTLWHQRFVFLSSALAGCGAALLGHRLARRLVGGGWAPAYAAIAILLGTSVTYYATHMPSYAHALDALACAGFLAAWAGTVGRRDRRRWLALGALLGLAMLIRVQAVGMGAVVALEVAVETVRARGRWRDAARWWAGGAATLAIALVVFAPQLVEWQLVFGSVRELPQGARYTRLAAPMIGELVFAPRNGWIPTTPLAGVGALGLAALALRPRGAGGAAPADAATGGRLIAVGLGVAAAIQVYLCSTILDWWGGAAFGQRRLCNLTLPLVVGLAAVLAAAARRTRRWPRWARHALAIAALAPPVGWNLWRVGQLRGGVPAPDALAPSCCDRLPPALRPAAQAVYAAIGNPLELPASAWYAWRHGVPLDRWDRSVGNYPLVPGLDALLDDRLWAERGVWRIAGGGIWPYLGAGWSAPAAVAVDRPRRYTLAPAATVLVPNLVPYAQRLTLWLAPAGAARARVRWNGAVVAEGALAGWTPLTFTLADPALHTNELTIEATPAPYLPAAGPALGLPVGVAVGDLELALVPPR